MKKKIFFLGMTVLILSLGLVFVGCKDDSDDSGDGGSTSVFWPDEWTPGTDYRPIGQGAFTETYMDTNGLAGSRFSLLSNKEKNWAFFTFASKNYGGGFDANLISIKGKELKIEITDPRITGYTKGQQFTLCTDWELKNDENGHKVLILTGGNLPEISNKTWFWFQKFGI